MLSLNLTEGEDEDIKGCLLRGQISFGKKTMNLLAIGWLAYLSSVKAPPQKSPVGPRTPEQLEQAREALMGNGTDELMEKGVDRDTKMARIQSGRGIWTTYGKGIVPVVINPNLRQHKHLIAKAMEQFHRNTCIRFVHRRRRHRNYIELVGGGTSCSSYVGRIGGRQVVSLANGCLYIGSVVHELGHAIGLDHEHERSDRDEYINVYWQNIKNDAYNNFEKLKTSSLSLPYNYGSVMHYGKTAFSKDPRRLITMLAKNRKHRLGQAYNKRGLNRGDVNHIKKLYKC